MKLMKNNLPSLLLGCLLLLTPMLSVEAGAPPPAQKLTLQTGANTFFAAPGNSQPVVIVLVASNEGDPVTDLGDTINNGGSPITLPPNWSLKFVTDSATICSTAGLPHIVPQLLVNQNDGIYRIQVIPEPSKGCAWKAGTVQYVIEINGPGNKRGIILGQFSIN